MSGDCLVRPQTLGTPASWRAWDGSDFTTRFVDPYTSPAFDPAKHVCEPVAPAQLGYAVRSLLELDGGRGFIATMDGATVTAYGVHVPTVFANTSADLVRWSALQPVVRFEPHAAACTATSPHTLMYSGAPRSEQLVAQLRHGRRDGVSLFPARPALLRPRSRFGSPAAVPVGRALIRANSPVLSGGGRAIHLARPPRILAP